jgi:hypothetical protein
MLNLNEEDLKAAIVAKAADHLLSYQDDLGGMVQKEIKTRIDAMFAAGVRERIDDAINEAIRNGFDREYQRIDQWGEPKGPKTSIRAELAKIVEGYWNTRVEVKSGKPTDSSYNTCTRAEYVMTTICAQDFSETMKASAINVTGALKDGLRNQLAKHMDQMLDGLFRVKSLQDQGKVEKPY